MEIINEETEETEETEEDIQMIDSIQKDVNLLGKHFLMQHIMGI